MLAKVFTTFPDAPPLSPPNICAPLSAAPSTAFRAELKRTRYYNEYLRLGDVEQSVALCAKADAEGAVVATLCRAGSLRPYTDHHLALMRQVAPHWANAYAIQRRLSHLQQRVDTLEAAVDAAPLAMAMLDERLHVTRMNPAAEQLFRQAHVLRLRHGQPEALFDDGLLRQALQEAVTGRHADGAPLRHAGKAILRDAAGRNALAASVHPLAGSRRVGDSVAILFLQSVGAGRPLATALRQLFALTPTEAALAGTFYRHGDLAQAALECGIALSTAETRIKVIYDKTGEHGQPALMRLLAAVAGTCGDEA